MDLSQHHCVQAEEWITETVPNVYGGGSSERKRDLLMEEFGSAICDCRGRADGTLWVDNLEYASRVRFCPICGIEEQPEPGVKPYPVKHVAVFHQDEPAK